MDAKILINVEEHEKRVAIVRNGLLDEFYVERPETTRHVGNVYRGVVKAIIPGIEAAFVEVGLGKNGFLYVSDIVNPPADVEEDFEDTYGSQGVLSRLFTSLRITSPARRESSFHPHPHHGKKGAGIRDLLKINQEVVVQVVKEAFGTKGVRLTTHITLPGRFLVLMPESPTRGISKRIEDESERQRLKGLLGKLKIQRGTGVIVRTAGENATLQDFQRDLKYLIGLWTQIRHDSRQVRAPALLHQEHDLVLRVLRDLFVQDFNELIVDEKVEYRRIRNFLSRFEPELLRKVKLYRSDQSLFESYQLEKTIEGLYQKRVDLKCGGHIIIEPTEGMVTIDVNTGRFTGKRNLEETALKVNLEAASEIARQVRLRDAGGIIVIDFIDMEAPGAGQKVLNELKQALRNDRARIKVLPISELGLVEMTRQRMRKSLSSNFYEVCPYCHGRGSVKSILTITIQVLREARRMLEKEKAGKLKIIVHPMIANRLISQRQSSLDALEKKYRARLAVEADPDCHVEEIKLRPLRKHEV